jgi:hypothetical protein
MIRRNTWITLAVFLVLLGFAYWWTRLRPEGVGMAEATPTQAPLWDVPAEEIVGITVEYLTTGDVAELEREDDGSWALIRPEEGTITQDRAQQAVDWLAAPRPRTTIPDPSDLLDFGLAEPTHRVTIRLADGSTRALEVGAETPIGTTQYLRLPDQPTVLVVSKYGLDGVLGLLEDVLATPTPTVTDTPEASSGEPSPTATEVPSSPESGGTATPEP